MLEPSERPRFDQELAAKHYLKNGPAVGRVLRDVAEYQHQWVALRGFSWPAFPLKRHDQGLPWSSRQVKERRHLIVQNSRLLVLAAAARGPNPASRVLQLACERLPQDWQEQFGYPVQVVETFVDPQRFRGTCYQAAGWEQLGPPKAASGMGRIFTPTPSILRGDSPQEAGPEALLALARGHWSLEPGPHYRRDRTQDEDRCPVRATCRCLDPWRSFCRARPPQAKALRSACRTFKRRCTVNRGDGSAASPGAARKNESVLQATPSVRRWVRQRPRPGLAARPAPGPGRRRQ